MLNFVEPVTYFWQLPRPEERQGDVCFVEEDCCAYLALDDQWVKFTAAEPRGSRVAELPRVFGDSYLMHNEFLEAVTYQLEANAAWDAFVQSKAQKRKILSSRS